MAKPSKDEQIGFHKGSLATLSKERIELIKLIQITEQLMQAHIKALKDLGIDIEAEAKKAQKELEKQKKSKLDERLA
ncbi:MAG: hypothetical protein AABW46_03250 [Nanoarchaeota archaeon]